jgi:ComF family protein
MLRAVTNSLLSIAFPQHCHICSRPVEKRADGIACASCWSATRFFDSTTITCSKCGSLLPPSRNSNDEHCRECADHQYDAALSAGVYENALAATVLELKRTPHLPVRVRDLLAGTIERAEPESYDVIIPVPLSPKRRTERGFNQAEVIGQFLSKHAGLPLDSASLVRHKHTPIHRVAMDSKAREASVKNAFKVVRPALVEGRSVLLVDDILTTGSTASFCAKELKKNRAAGVRILTLARTVRSTF